MTNWKPSALPPSNGTPSTVPVEVDGHPVVDIGRLRGRALLECASLLAQDLDRLVNGLLGHLAGDALNLCRGEVADLHFGIDLEGRIECHFSFRRIFPFR